MDTEVQAAPYPPTPDHTAVAESEAEPGYLAPELMLSVTQENDFQAPSTECKVPEV